MTPPVTTSMPLTIMGNLRKSRQFCFEKYSSGKKFLVNFHVKYAARSPIFHAKNANLVVPNSEVVDFVDFDTTFDTTLILNLILI